MGEKLKHGTPCSHVHTQRVSVPFEYTVCFTRHVFRPDNRSFVDAVARREPTRRHRLFVVIDSGVADAWPNLTRDIAAYCAAHQERLQLVEAPRIATGGEQAKQSSALVDSLHADMQRLGIDRHSFVVALGGGAMLDAVGYAAATAHRGVRLIRIPTTVLAQNDSGIGVKNGINAFGAKNFLGTFAPPFAVINDSEFLKTLSPRDSRAGVAEAVKVALIRDPSFFVWLEEHVTDLAAFAMPALAHSVRVGAEIHMRHIATGGDPFEQGSARPLDFGHWAAHKLEALSHHDVRHGEAVAIGMALDTRYSSDIGLLPADALERVCALLEGLGFALWHPALEQLDAHGLPAVLAGLREFREHLGGELTVTLLREVGTGIEVNAVDAERVIDALAWLKHRHNARHPGR